MMGGQREDKAARRALRRASRTYDKAETAYIAAAKRLADAQARCQRAQHALEAARARTVRFGVMTR